MIDIASPSKYNLSMSVETVLHLLCDVIKGGFIIKPCEAWQEDVVRDIESAISAEVHCAQAQQHYYLFSSDSVVLTRRMLVVIGDFLFRPSVGRA